MTRVLDERGLVRELKELAKQTKALYDKLKADGVGYGMVPHRMVLARRLWRTYGYLQEVACARTPHMYGGSRKREGNYGEPHDVL